MSGKSGKMEKPKNIKLTYFDERARAEGIRLTLEYAGINYQDHRIPYSFEEDSEWISKLKSGKLSRRRCASRDNKDIFIITLTLTLFKQCYNLMMTRKLFDWAFLTSFDEF